MRRHWFGMGGGVLAFIGWLLVVSQGAIPVAQSQRAWVTPAPLPMSPPDERHADPHLPTISPIDSNTPGCYRPVDGTGACYITWSYLNVTASASQYVISMTVSINGDLRAYQAGFFQTAMYIPGNLYGDGFKVSCGVQGAGGILGMGKAYNYTIRAKETGGQEAVANGAVVCPTDTLRFFLPGILKP